MRTPDERAQRLRELLLGDPDSTRGLDRSVEAIWIVVDTINGRLEVLISDAEMRAAREASLATAAAVALAAIALCVACCAICRCATSRGGHRPSAHGQAERLEKMSGDYASLSAD